MLTFVSHIVQENATELVSTQEELYLCTHAKLKAIILRGATDPSFQGPGDRNGCIQVL